MKKLLATIMAATMVMGLAACGSDKPAEPESNNSAVTEENEENSEVDYKNTPFEEWIYTSEDYKLLSNINSVQFGSAGSSLKEAAAAVDLVVLSTEDDAVAQVENFMHEMTATQKDYFSYSWDVIAETAKGFFENPENLGEYLELAGVEGFNIEEYSKDDLKTLMDGVEGIFEEMHVERVWVTSPDFAM